MEQVKARYALLRIQVRAAGWGGVGQGEEGWAGQGRVGGGGMGPGGMGQEFVEQFKARHSLCCGTGRAEVRCAKRAEIQWGGTMQVGVLRWGDAGGGWVVVHRLNCIALQQSERRVSHWVGVGLCWVRCRSHVG